MATWMDYLKVRETKGLDAAWQFARTRFAKGSLDYDAARRFHAPSAADKRTATARSNAINSVTRREMREHCQFEGLRKIGR